MSQYLNKIGLIKYNNDTYKQVDQTQYYSVREPQLVSSDPRINFFNYPWKSDAHWSYNNFGQGWYYGGKEDIAYTTEIIPSDKLSCYNPVTSAIIGSSFVYNVIPIEQFLLSSISGDLINRKLFADPLPMYYLKTTNNQFIRIKFNNDYRAYGDIQVASTYTYTTEDGKNLVLDWVPSSVSQYQATEIIQDNISTIVSGYWVSGAPISGILYSEPKIGQGSINDIYSNELHFEVKSPNLSSITNNDILCSNLVEGLFTNIPGTDYITGICTTKMYFLDDQYVYMRGLFKGNIEIKNGILQNEIAGTSTIIKKVKVNKIQGTLKNITDLPEEIKYGLDHYYAWGWLYGIDNIKYTNIWYKNEISGTLNSSSNNYDQISLINDRYSGPLSISITTNNGVEDVVNILTGMFYKEEEQNIITGYMEGTIEPYSIKMKGILTGYYTKINNNIIKPLQLAGTLYNKSVIGDDLRQILDIKYANTLGRKGLTYPDPLHGQRLNFATKNYDPFNKPYMLQTWKIIEYKTSNEQIDYQNEIPNDMTDLNTYIVDNKYIKQNYRSKIHKTNEQLQTLSGNAYFVGWYIDQEFGDFVIKGSELSSDLSGNIISFNSQVDAQKYIKNMCEQSNLKLKNYTISGNVTSYVLNSSDLEIK